MEDLGRQLSTAAASLRGELATLQAGKADPCEARAALADGLASKADAADAAALRAQLASKAARAELEALLDSLAAGSAGGAAGDGVDAGDSASASTTDTGSATAPASGNQPHPAAGADAPVPGSAPDGVSCSRRGTRDAAGPDVAQQLRKLGLQCALLQERIATKADLPAVEELSANLAGTRKSLVQLQLSLQQLSGQVEGLQDGLAGVRDAHDRHAADAGLHAAAGSSRATPPPAAATAGSPEAAQSLADMLQGSLSAAAAAATRLAALEAAVGSLQAAVHMAGLPPPPAPASRRTTGEAPASSRLVQQLAAQLSDLTAQVGRLATADGATVAHSGGELAARSAGSNERDSSSSSAAERHSSGSASVKPHEPTSASAAGAGSGSAPRNAAAAAGAVFDLSLAAELDARLAEAEQALAELQAGKAEASHVADLAAALAGVPGHQVRCTADTVHATIVASSCVRLGTTACNMRMRVHAACGRRQRWSSSWRLSRRCWSAWRATSAPP